LLLISLSTQSGNFWIHPRASENHETLSQGGQSPE